MRLFRPWLGAALVAGALFAPSAARAADASGDGPPSVPRRSRWEQGRDRAFVAGRFDLGIVFARPAIMVGYGEPHWKWFGADAYVLTTNSFVATYAGTRASLPFADLTIGVRDTYAYYRSFLPRKAAYTQADVESPNGARSRYLAIDTELTLVGPIPTGYAYLGVLSTRLLDTPRDKDVFDESLRVVMKNRFALGLRLGYLAALGKDSWVKAGILGEHVIMPERGHASRVGPIATLTLTEHTELVFVLTVVVDSPDSLGLVHGSYGFLGLRYRWATGDEKSQFP
jgi:hypothetical protein